METELKSIVRKIQRDVIADVITALIKKRDDERFPAIVPDHIFDIITNVSKNYE